MATPNGNNPQYEGAIRTGALVDENTAGAAGQLVLSFTDSSTLGLYVGTGVPGFQAAKGSLFIRTDGSSTSTRMYVNTGASTVWTNFTTAA